MERLLIIAIYLFSLTQADYNSLTRFTTEEKAKKRVHIELENQNNKDYYFTM